MKQPTVGSDRVAKVGNYYSSQANIQGQNAEEYISINKGKAATVALYGQIPENRLAAVLFLGNTCYKNKNCPIAYKTALASVAAKESEKNFIRASALMYYGTTDTSDRMLNYLDSIIRNGDLDYEIRKGAVRALEANTASASPIVLQYANIFLSKNGKNTFDESPGSRKLECDIIEALVTKLNNGSTAAKNYLFEATRMQNKVDANTKACSAIALGNLGMGINEIRHTLEWVATSYAFPISIAKQARSIYKMYYPGYLQANGSTSDMPGGQNFLIEFREHEVEINKGTQEMMFFIITWYAGEGAFILLKTPTLKALQAIGKWLGDAFPETEEFAIALNKSKQAANAVEEAAKAKKAAAIASDLEKNADYYKILKEKEALKAAKLAEKEKALGLVPNAQPVIPTQMSSVPKNMLNKFDFVVDANNSTQKATTLNNFFGSLRNEYGFTDEVFNSPGFKKVMDQFDKAHNIPIETQRAEKLRELVNAKQELQSFVEAQQGRKLLAQEINDLYKPLADDGVLGKSLWKDLFSSKKTELASAVNLQQKMYNDTELVNIFKDPSFASATGEGENAFMLISGSIKNENELTLLTSKIKAI
ncbi:MAG: hypothetical protein WCQ47_08750, partial [bacterium]